ncbi:unnamed protein product [Mytilus coruscus]|uniref:Uncharacterized protein n=1 Tax=Mytilus coruscus TaxID=42192 RepID=A0A6J8AYF1_MYTCO|nr:unnamed protein product [Mytilus coruscus]
MKFTDEEGYEIPFSLYTNSYSVSGNNMLQSDQKTGRSKQYNESKTHGKFIDEEGNETPISNFSELRSKSAERTEFSSYLPRTERRKQNSRCDTDDEGYEIPISKYCGFTNNDGLRICSNPVDERSRPSTERSVFTICTDDDENEIPLSNHTGIGSKTYREYDELNTIERKNNYNITRKILTIFILITLFLCCVTAGLTYLTVSSVYESHGVILCAFDECGNEECNLNFTRRSMCLCPEQTYGTPSYLVDVT